MQREGLWLLRQLLAGCGEVDWGWAARETSLAAAGKAERW